MNVVTTDETYHFLCRRCRGQWEERYQIRRWVGRDGEDGVGSGIAGRADSAPSSGTCCPYCGWCRTLLLPNAPPLTKA